MNPLTGFLWLFVLIAFQKWAVMVEETTIVCLLFTDVLTGLG